MPSIREEIAADMAAAVPLYGQSFEWNGHSYPCVRRDAPAENVFQDVGGYAEKVSYALTVAKAALTRGIPGDGDLVDNSAYQIKRRNGHDDDAAAQVVLYIGSVDE